MFKYYTDSLELQDVLPMIMAYQNNEVPLLEKSFEYYNGEQKIYQKEVAEDRPNNKVVTNYCKQVVDTYQGYINMGASTTNSEFVRDYLTELSDSLRDAMICGITYDLVYYENGEKKLAKLRPTTTMIFKDTTISHNHIGGATWNEFTVYENGSTTTYVDLFIYDDKVVRKYRGNTLETVQFVEEEPHYLNRCPIVEGRITPNFDSLIRGIFDLQDSYNLIDSSYLDSRETYSNAYLVIKGMNVTSDQASDLIDSQNKIINLPLAEGDASYLIKPDNATDIISMLDNIKNRIFTVTCTPDFNDTKFATQSGAALRNRLIAFNNNVHNLEREYISTIYYIGEVIGEEVDFTYNSISPVDIDSIVDMVVKLNGIVSAKTLLSQLPFVEDVEEEIKNRTQ